MTKPLRGRSDSAGDHQPMRFAGGRAYIRAAATSKAARNSQSVSLICVYLCSSVAPFPPASLPSCQRPASRPRQLPRYWTITTRPSKSIVRSSSPPSTGGPARSVARRARSDERQGDRPVAPLRSKRQGVPHGLPDRPLRGLPQQVDPGDMDDRPEGSVPGPVSTAPSGIIGIPASSRNGPVPPRRLIAPETPWGSSSHQGKMFRFHALTITSTS